MHSLRSDWRLFCNRWWKHWFSPSTYYYWVKYKIQRANRGWADCDTWSLDGYLSEWLPGALQYLKDHGHGYPGMETPESWDAIQDKIIAGFKANNRISDLLYEEELGKYNGSNERFAKSQELIKRDERLFEEGFDLFHKYFGDLWD